MNQFFTLVLFLGVTTFLYANEQEFIFDNINISAGNWYDFNGDVQTTEDGDTSSMLDFDLNPYIAIGVDYKIKNSWVIIPELGYVLRRTSEDSRIKKDLIFFRVDGAYRYNDMWRFRAGTSFMILTTAAEGGSELVNNGNGQTEYFVPGQRSTALNQTLDFALEAIFSKKWAMRFSTYIYAWNEDEERKLTHSIGVSYFLPLSELMK